ncbi:urease [Verticillium alfalfae VaMs.102]|uniref:Urease n=1 Tax=Verticillium alfalfae (strain VaMs.102 / ATCC MYA-4576 / FGSC 10136) TaxID=526221 RepID=C9SGW3_VERA1|nr:urease [Verticillium alfalfae VaMs.102]EEY17585.1 urease [Verticillium alfalfae VaMs.102]
MGLGSTMLGRRHVQPSVCSTLHEIQVEGTFPSGTYLVTVHNPIATDDGNLARALYGYVPRMPLTMISLYRSLPSSSRRGSVALVAVRTVKAPLNANRSTFSCGPRQR